MLFQRVNLVGLHGRTLKAEFCWQLADKIGPLMAPSPPRADASAGCFSSHYDWLKKLALTVVGQADSDKYSSLPQLSSVLHRHSTYRLARSTALNLYQCLQLTSLIGNNLTSQRSISPFERKSARRLDSAQSPLIRTNMIIA
jgi:hypothetical protein